MFVSEDTVLFSILIANYNNSVFFNDCLNSVFNQTYKNWEIIFVDDGSTDDSVDKIKKIIDVNGLKDRVHIYANDKNHGCGYTKRKCAELANGEICAFLDPDDKLTEDALELMIVAHNKNPNASLIGSRRFFCDEMLKVVDVAPSLANKVKSFKNQLDTPFVITHFASYKNSAYKKTDGIDACMIRGIDQDLYLKLEEVGSVAFIDKPLYYYRNNKNSISLNDNHYKATAWHIYAIINTCRRRNLSFDDYCYLTKIKKNRQEKFINSIMKPLSLLKMKLIRRRNILNYKAESKYDKNIFLTKDC